MEPRSSKKIDEDMERLKGMFNLLDEEIARELLREPSKTDSNNYRQILNSRLKQLFQDVTSPDLSISPPRLQRLSTDVKKLKENIEKNGGLDKVKRDMLILAINSKNADLRNQFLNYYNNCYKDDLPSIDMDGRAIWLAYNSGDFKLANSLLDSYEKYGEKVSSLSDSQKFQIGSNAFDNLFPNSIQPPPDFANKSSKDIAALIRSKTTDVTPTPTSVTATPSQPAKQTKPTFLQTLLRFARNLFARIRNYLKSISSTPPVAANKQQAEQGLDSKAAVSASDTHAPRGVGASQMIHILQSGKLAEEANALFTNLRGKEPDARQKELLKLFSPKLSKDQYLTQRKAFLVSSLIDIASEYERYGDLKIKYLKEQILSVLANKGAISYEGLVSKLKEGFDEQTNNTSSSREAGRQTIIGEIGLKITDAIKKAEETYQAPVKEQKRQEEQQISAEGRGTAVVRR